MSWRLVDIPFVPPMFFPPFGWIGCCLICVPLPSNKGTAPSPNVFTGAFCLRDNVFWTVWDHHHSTFNSICHPTVVHENRAIFVGASFSIDTQCTQCTQCTHTHTHMPQGEHLLAERHLWIPSAPPPIFAYGRFGVESERRHCHGRCVAKEAEKSSSSSSSKAKKTWYRAKCHSTATPPFHPL